MCSTVPFTTLRTLGVQAEVRPRYHISDYDDDDNYFYGARGYYPLDVFQRTGKFEKEPVFGHSDHLQLKYKDYDKGWFDLRELESVDARKNALLKRRTITARGLAL